MSEQSPGPIVSQSDKRTQDVVDKWTLREREDGCSDILRDGISYGSLLHDNASFIVGRLNQRDRFMEAALADAATIASLREQVERQERELDVINSSHRDIGRRYEAAQQQVERLELELMDERRRFIRDNPYAAHNAILAEARTAAESRVSMLEGVSRQFVLAYSETEAASGGLDKAYVAAKAALNQSLPVNAGSTSSDGGSV